MTEPDVLFLFQGGALHDAHRGFAAALDADLRHFETAAEPTPDEADQDRHSELARLRAARRLPAGYDVVVAEGSAALQTLVWYGWLTDRRATTILLACDETFLDVSQSRMHHVWSLARTLTRRVDGCISISDLVESWVRPYLPDGRHEVVHPTTTPEKFDALRGLAVSQPVGSVRLLSVGDARAMKNYGTLVEAVTRVRSTTDADVTLTLVGAGHADQPYAAEPFVETPGFVERAELYRRLESASLYVQPSTGDGFGVAALEAMLAGLPVLVSEQTGLRELLADEWVTGTDPDAIATSLRTVLSMERSTLVGVGERNRERASELSPDRQAERFAETVRAIHQSR